MGHKFESLLDHIIFMEIDHKIISTDIQGQLSVSSKKYVNKYWLTAQLTKPAKEKCGLDK